LQDQIAKTDKTNSELQKSLHKNSILNASLEDYKMCLKQRDDKIQELLTKAEKYDQELGGFLDNIQEENRNLKLKDIESKAEIDSLRSKLTDFERIDREIKQELKQFSMKHPSTGTEAPNSEKIQYLYEALLREQNKTSTLEKKMEDVKKQLVENVPVLMDKIAEINKLNEDHAKLLNKFEKAREELKKSYFEKVEIENKYNELKSQNGDISLYSHQITALLLVNDDLKTKLSAQNIPFKDQEIDNNSIIYKDTADLQMKYNIILGKYKALKRNQSSETKIIAEPKAGNDFIAKNKEVITILDTSTPAIKPERSKTISKGNEELDKKIEQKVKEFKK
jgi:chromosome segregation ATPase